MRKRFMLVAAIAAVLSLGACVDDKESASVEAIRNAKAEQLKSVAALNNAKAEAELIYANAEKAAKEAYAAYQKALAEAALADAEYEKMLTAQAKERFAIELEVIKAEAQRDIATAKLAAAQAEEALLNMADEKILNLYHAYAEATYELSTLNEELLAEKISLKKLQGNLIDAKAYVEQQTITYNNTIAKQTALRDALKALPENNRAELEAQIEQYNAELIPLKIELVVKQQAIDKASDAYLKARNILLPYYSSPSVKLIEAVKTLDSDFWNYYVTTSVNYDLTETKSISQYSLIQYRVTLAVNDLTGKIASAEAILGVPSTSTIPATGVYVQYEALKAAQEAAQDAYNDDKSEANRDALEVAKSNVERYKGGTLKDAKQDVDDANDKLNVFKALIASFAEDDLAAYNTALKDLKTLAEAYEKAEDEYTEVNDKINAINTLKSSVNSILSATTNLPEEIAKAERAIAAAQKDIADLVNVDTEETAIAVAEGRIEVLENEIAVMKIIVQKAKAALDAALV